jgi:nucleoside 2-deoxyribosyltransferase
MTNIYLAGPLFTVAERDFNARLAARLREAGYEVFVPQDVEQRGATARQIFTDDVAGVDWADVVLANMDGPDPDSGTCWECGYAFAKQKTIVAFRTDFRAADEAGIGPFNLMLSESAARCLDIAFKDKNRSARADIDSVAAAILGALRELGR